MTHFIHFSWRLAVAVCFWVAGNYLELNWVVCFSLKYSTIQVSGKSEIWMCKGIKGISLFCNLNESMLLDEILLYNQTVFTFPLMSYLLCFNQFWKIHHALPRVEKMSYQISRSYLILWKVKVTPFWGHMQKTQYASTKNLLYMYVSKQHKL